MIVDGSPLVQNVSVLWSQLVSIRWCLYLQYGSCDFSLLSSSDYGVYMHIYIMVTDSCTMT